MRLRTAALRYTLGVADSDHHLDRAREAPVRRGSRLLVVLVAVLLGVPAGFTLAHAIRVPMVRALENYQPAIITRVYDRTGIGFAEYSIQKRIVVRKNEISPWLVDAIVATEDADFFHHGGINPKAILRAALKDLIARKKVEGASTLTQQLAKQVFLTPAKDFRRKINEVFLSVDIEKNFTKDQIFELYANQVYLGHGAYGVEAALRSGLTALGLVYTVGVKSSTTVWAPGIASLPPAPYSGRGRRPVRPMHDAAHKLVNVEQLALDLPKSSWRNVTWREGSNASLSGLGLVAGHVRECRL